MSFKRTSRGHLRGGGPHLLYLGHPGIGHCPDTTWMANTTNAATVAASPFDGVFFQVPGSSTIMSASAITEATLSGLLDPLASKNYGACTHNMPVLYIEDIYSGDLDYTNNTLWANIASNWANLAAAAQDNPNLVGICLDNEAYGTWNGSTLPYPWDYRSDLNPVPYNTADGSGIFAVGVTYADARDQVHARGKQVMDAVRAVWPDVRVLFLHGGYRSYSDTDEALAPTSYNDTSFNAELLAAFIAGFVDSAAAGHHQATIIDGGELYEVYDEAAVYRMNRWRRQMAVTNTDARIKPSFAPAYQTNNAIGIYDLAFNDPPAPGTVREHIGRIMRQVDTYAWLYPENGAWDLLGVAGTPPSTAIFNAVRDGRLIGKGILPAGAAANASGIALPGNDVAGWTLTMADDFDTPFSAGAVNGATGAFPAPYATTMYAYLDGSPDTTKNTQGSNSVYRPSTNLSCTGSKLVTLLNVVSGEARGVTYVAMPGGVWGQLYGRFEVCFRVPAGFNGFKIAFLLWPTSDTWPGDAEVDFPEGNLNAGQTFGFNMLHENSAAGNHVDFDHHTYAAVPGPDGDWHVATIEWGSTFVRALWDGVTVGTTYDRVPNTPMRWSIQAETEFGGYPAGYPTASDAGIVEVDWMAVWAAASPAVPGAGAAPSSTTALTEAFTGTNGAVWSAANWASVTTTAGASAQIQTNKGRMTTGTLGAYNDHVYRRSATAHADDHIITATVNITNVGECYPYVAFRDTGTGAAGYRLLFYANASWVVLTSPTETEVAVVKWGSAWTTATSIKVEILTVDDVASIRLWDAAGARPTNPTIQTNVSAYTGTRCGLGVIGGSPASARTVEFDDFAIARVLMADNASGIALPVDDQAGWSLAYANDFDTPMALGAVVTTGDDAPFPAPYAADLWAYPLGWPDDNAGLNSDDSQYDPASTLSIAGSVLRQHMSVISGSARSTVVGVYPGGTGRLYGRFQVCFRVPTSFHGWKTAWLLWPDSEVWPRDGEIDWPEGSLDGQMDGFLHHQGATVGSDQTGFSSGVAYVSPGLGGGWHVATIEWAADYCRFLLDGATVGTSYTRVPNTSMGWRLMTVVQYANPPTGQPSASDAGDVEIDWVAVWDDAGFVPYGFAQPAHTSVFTEPFTGSDGTAWNAANWTSTVTAGAGSASSIQTNRGRLTTTAGSYTAHIFRAHGSVPVNMMAEFTTRITTLTECYPRACFRDVAGNGDNAYYVHFEPTANYIQLRRTVAGAETTLAQMAHTYVLNQDLVCEILAVGSDIQVRIWPAAGSRPAPPSLGATDATHAGTNFSFGLHGGTAAATRTVEFDARTISSVAESVARLYSDNTPMLYSDDTPMEYT